MTKINSNQTTPPSRGPVFHCFSSTDSLGAQGPSQSDSLGSADSVVHFRSSQAPGSRPAIWEIHRPASRRSYTACVMPVLISMLRGVNLGKHNRINMSALRALYESLKF